MKPFLLFLGTLLLLMALSGCSSTEVVKVNLADDASYYWLGSRSSETKTIYKTTDEKVCLHVVLKPNFSLSSPVFTVQWVQPCNEIYLSKPVSTKYGNNQVLITELPIKDNEPSRLPGRWRVKLLKEEITIVDFPFTIDQN